MIIMTTLTSTRISLSNMKMLIKCCHTDTSKHTLQYVYFDGLTATSTDGHRVYSIPYPHDNEPFLIKHSDLKVLIKGAKKNDSFIIPHNSPDKQLESKIGKYPEVKMLLSKNYKHVITINRKLEIDFCNAINDVAISYVAFRVKDKQFEITHGCQSTETLKFRWLNNSLLLATEYLIDTEYLSFQQAYLGDLANIKFDTISIVDNECPVIFTDTINGSYLLIMPFYFRDNTFNPFN